MLAHSAVYFSRQEWLPVADARNGPSISSAPSTSTSAQTSTNQQVADEGGAEGSFTSAVGANSGTDLTTSTQGTSGVVEAAGSRLGEADGNNDNVSTTIETSDPDVTEAALLANTVTSAQADQTVASVTNTALSDEESTATAAIGNANAAIAANAYTTALNDQFGESALQTAADSEANDTTALEASATEEAQVATNALAAAQNETLAGVTPAQEFQEVSPQTPGTITSANTWATYITIAAGVLAIIFYFRAKKT
jgi:hypothetical protein